MLKICSGGPSNFFKSLQIAHPQILICYICKGKKYVFADLQKFYSKSAKKLAANRKIHNLQIPKKDWVRKFKIHRVPSLPNARKLINYFSPQICRFAICGTYSQIDHLWKIPHFISFFILMQLAILHMVLIARFDHTLQSSFMFFFTIKVLLPFRSLD